MIHRRFLSLYRVRSSADFQRAYRRRCRASDQWIILFGHPNGLPYPRLGISASRRLGGAVVRNRWKRFLREAFRLSRPQLPSGIDLIVIPRPAALPSLDALCRSLVCLAEKAATNIG